MNAIKEFFGNYMIIAPAAAWFSAQIIKVFTGMFRTREFKLTTLLFSNGGMPSSHSAAVCALVSASAIKFGPASFEIAISGLFAMIVMIDALGVRYETGEQAKIINKIVKEIFSGRPEDINTGLKELVGHTPSQVFVGAVWGVIVGILMSFVML